jgi:hypothetical protein
MTHWWMILEAVSNTVALAAATVSLAKAAATRRRNRRDR